MSPKISIIIPCYKVEKFIERCFLSVQKQTLKDIEIILVDDESPDEVPRFCNEYALMDQRVKVIHKKNGGLGYARNSGLDIATGEYVAFVDSDDFVELDMYKTLYDDAIGVNADVVYCNMQREQVDGSWVMCREMKNRTVFEGQNVINLMLDIVASAPYEKIERKYQMSVWHGIYKRSILENNKIRFLSERDVVSEDLPFNVSVLLNSHIVVYRTECFYHYCLNGASLTATFLPEKMERYKTLYYYLEQKLDNLGMEATQRVNRFFIGSVRQLVLQLESCNYNEKIKVLRDYSNDKIWKEIMLEFKYSWLPKPASIHLWLLIHKCLHILLGFSKFYNWCRK